MACAGTTLWRVQEQLYGMCRNNFMACAGTTLWRVQEQLYTSTFTFTVK
jgi:hypothetical protein